ncbi:hypothetical protein MKX03_002187, partial [Papaver bracteatum]
GKFSRGEKIGFVDLAIGWIPFWTRITKEIVGVKLVDEEHMPLLNTWFDDVLDVEILKQRLPPRDKTLAHCKMFRESESQKLLKLKATTFFCIFFCTALLI